MQPGRGKQACLPPAPPVQLAIMPRLVDSSAGPGKDGADGGAEAFRQADRDSIKVRRILRW
eukprot:scaffold9492_cov108-Isochrysis_galbana.AAC.3